MRNFIGMARGNIVDRVGSNPALVAGLAIAASVQLVACGAAIDPESTDGESGDANVASASQALGRVADASAFGCSGTKIALQPYYGDEYCGVSTSDSGDMGCGDRHAYSWDVFTVYRLTNNGSDTGYFALQENNRWRYVSANNGGGSSIRANRTAVGDWEMFQAEVQPGFRRFSISTYYRPSSDPLSRWYVTAENGGYSAMNANRTAVGDWETFYVACY